MPPWFLWLSGFAMLLLGGLRLVTRRHEPSVFRRWFHFTWGCLCCAFGVTLLAMALGYLGHRPPPPAPPRVHWR